MNTTWHRPVALVATMVIVLALLISSNFFTHPEENLRDQHDEARLKNDSLMGVVQTLQKQLWENEQELQERNSLIDSITYVRTPLPPGNNASE